MCAGRVHSSPWSEHCSSRSARSNVTACEVAAALTQPKSGAASEVLSACMMSSLLLKRNGSVAHCELYTPESSGKPAGSIAVGDRRKASRDQSRRTTVGGTLFERRHRRLRSAAIRGSKAYSRLLRSSSDDSLTDFQPVSHLAV